MSGTSFANDTLDVTGAVGTPLALTDASLASNFTPVTVTVGSGASAVTYTGASVYKIITAAAFQYPTAAKNGSLLDYLQLTGASGGQVVLSEGEVDPSFGGATSTDIIAYARNGTAIAPTLIVPGDVNGGAGGRDIADVVNIAVGTATVSASAITSAPSPALSVSGAVSGTPVYTEAQVQALGTVVQNDTFLQGTAPKSYGFTGVPMLALLQNAGATVDVADSYVVAAGTDGYAVVYSGGEIDPAYRSSPTAIVAYDDGTGTLPSIGGIANALRTTAPTDSKGGRYVSALDSLNIADAGASALIAGFTPYLAGYNAATTLALTGALAALTPGGTMPYGSVSPDGSGFATPVAGALNIAVVSAPLAGGTILLPTGYAAELLQGTTDATLVDAAVGGAVLVANQGNDVLVGNKGSDTLFAGGGNDTLFGSGAGDVLVANGGTNTLVLGAGADTAITTTRPNLVFLGQGPAQIYSAAADTIVGGGGAATVFMSAGAAVFGGGGAMTLVNGAVASTVDGGSGALTLFGGAGGGLAFAGSAGGSVLVGAAGAATLGGAAAGDQLYATSGANDFLVAGAGNETLAGIGSTGADVYFAGAGNDLLAAGAGPSTVVAGTGADTMLAGAGAETFVFNNGAAGGTDLIIGFNPTLDVIALGGYAASQPAAVAASAATTGGSTILSLSDGTRIVLSGVASIGGSSVI